VSRQKEKALKARKNKIENGAYGRSKALDSRGDKKGRCLVWVSTTTEVGWNVGEYGGLRNNSRNPYLRSQIAIGGRRSVQQGEGRESSAVTMQTDLYRGEEVKGRE